MSYHRLMMENQTMFTKLLFEKLAGAELSPGQPKILEYLLSHDGSVQKDIAEACLIEQATVTSLLAGLEKSGLVKRAASDSDKRYMCVYLTDTGLKKAQMCIGAIEKSEDIALKGFSEREKNAFIEFLRRANDNLKTKEE